MAEPEFHRYETREALAEALAVGVAAVLAGSLATDGEAHLVVSGGSTPKRFFERLSTASIDWPRVTVALVDERWVPEEDARSNAAMLRRHLLQGLASGARFVPFFIDGETPEAALETLNERFHPTGRPADVVVLGMGTDGHTASWFPHAPGLAACLDPQADDTVAIVRPEDKAEARVTLTLQPVLNARFLALHIEGEEKLKTFEPARSDGPAEAMPIRAVLRAEGRDPLKVFWAP